MPRSSTAQDSSHLDSIEVDIEYMIVDRRTFLPRNIASSILREREKRGATISEPFASIRVSHTITQHSLKLSNRIPESNFYRLETCFLDAIRALNAELEAYQAMLLPGSVHPTLNPRRGVSLYDGPTENFELKLARELDYQRHAWLNNQNVCFRVSYRDESEFLRTQDALILLLAKLPALAAASPYLEGETRDKLDTRSHFLASKHREFPSLTGNYFPERAASAQDYQTIILDPIRTELADFPNLSAQESIEQLNARAFVPLLSQKKIEVRAFGTQEAPCADLAIVYLLLKTLKQLLKLPASALARAASKSNAHARKKQLLAVATAGADAELFGPSMDTIFKLGRLPVSGRNFWEAMIERASSEQSMDYGFDTIRSIIDNGPLATRMQEIGGNFDDVVDATRLLALLASGLTRNRILAHSEQHRLPRKG